MNKKELDVLSKINNLEKKKYHALKRISRLYDIAIWAGRKIETLTAKVEKLEQQIDDLANAFDDEGNVIETVEETSKDEPKRIA